VLVFALTIFAGAFLLFEVEPLIAKYILPWFGGSPGVWTTCMLFFQVLLLCGYAYAHLVSGRKHPRTQALVHLALLAAAAALLPITPSASFKPENVNRPELRILALLTVSVGMPGLVLASTGPLLQGWFSRARPGESPYRLYALSNLGSLLALLGYPFFVEPNLSRNAQAVYWSIGFGAFALLSAACALGVWRAAATDSGEDHDRSPGERVGETGVGTQVLWFCLPACACVLLLAVTNQLCVDVAVIPFLWVVPLSIYLLSFILVFHSARWYPRAVYGVLLPVAVGGVVAVLEYNNDKDLSILMQVVIYSAVLFVCCMVCHGELVRLKPDPSRLTSFYLMIAAGGAAGGVFVALAAPFLFRGYFELHAGLLACCVLALVVYSVDKTSVLHGLRPRWAWVVVSVVLVSLAGGFVHEAKKFTAGALAISRNFYGVLSVTEEGAHASTHRYVLSHGTTLHGVQFDDPIKRRWATSYYGEGSGIGVTVRALPREGPRRIGVVGLGAGTIAAWGAKGDTIRFYEINPEVKRFAETDFTYLKDTPAQTEVVLGDARISLEREEPQRFDVLVLDAFSGDAIPVHLLTKEAFEIYLKHLLPGGVIAVHLSNAYLDLWPVVFLAADHFGLGKVLIQDYRAGDLDDENPAQAQLDREHGLKSSTWVLVTRNQEFLESKTVKEAESDPEESHPGVRLWTDDDTNLFRILRD
jgi:hypothetical protein